MNPIASPKQRSAQSNVLAGVLGGLVVLVIGSVLISTGVIDTGDTKVVKEQAPLTNSVATSGGGETGSAEGRTVADIYKQEGRGVVFVESRGVSEGDSIFGTPQQGTATGSGFVVDRDGTILTNAHVVEGAQSVSIRLEQNGGDSIPAEVKGRDTSSDLAVLKVDPDKLKSVTPLPLGDSSKTEVGDAVVAIGNPFGFTRTVTTGIVSAKQRQIDAPNGFPIRNVIQTDASINPGNSGGPLLDDQGRVIGINSQIATGGGQGSVGIGFAIPINTAKRLLPQLEKGGQVQRAYLGVTMAPVTKQLAQDLNLPVDSGAMVQDVTGGSPAAKAGLRGGRTQTSDGLTIGGDVIVKVDGKSVRSPEDVAAAIGDHKPGDTVKIEYYRGGDKKTATVKLGNRPNQAPADQSQGDGGLLPLP
jgi:S1-C subfamily serine protease